MRPEPLLDQLALLDNDKESKESESHNAEKNDNERIRKVIEEDIRNTKFSDTWQNSNNNHNLPKYLEALIIAGEYDLAIFFVDHFHSTAQKANTATVIREHIFCLRDQDFRQPVTNIWFKNLVNTKLPFLETLNQMPADKMPFVWYISNFLSPIIMTVCLAILSEKKQLWELASKLLYFYETQKINNHQDEGHRIARKHICILLSLLLFFAPDTTDSVKLFIRVIKIILTNRSNYYRATEFSLDYKSYPFMFRDLKKLDESNDSDCEKTIQHFITNLLHNQTRTIQQHFAYTNNSDKKSAHIAKFDLEIDAVCLLLHKAKMYSAYQHEINNDSEGYRDTFDNMIQSNNQTTKVKFLSSFLITDPLKTLIKNAQLEHQKLLSELESQKDAHDLYRNIDSRLRLKFKTFATPPIDRAAIWQNRERDNRFNMIKERLIAYLDPFINTANKVLNSIPLTELQNIIASKEKMLKTIDDLNTELDKVKRIFFHPDFSDEDITKIIKTDQPTIESSRTNSDVIEFLNKLIDQRRLDFYINISESIAPLFEYPLSGVMNLNGNMSAHNDSPLFHLKKTIRVCINALKDRQDDCSTIVFPDLLSESATDGIIINIKSLRELAYSSPSNYSNSNFEKAYTKLTLKFIIIHFFSQAQHHRRENNSKYIDSLFHLVDINRSDLVSDMFKDIKILYEPLTIDADKNPPDADIEELFSLSKIKEKRDQAIVDFMDEIINLNIQNLKYRKTEKYQAANNWIRHYKELISLRDTLIAKLTEEFLTQGLSHEDANYKYAFISFINNPKHNNIKTHLHLLFKDLYDISHMEQKAMYQIFMNELIAKLLNGTVYWLYKTEKKLKDHYYTDLASFLDLDANADTSNDNMKMRLMKVFLTPYTTYHFQVEQTLKFISKKQQNGEHTEEIQQLDSKIPALKQQCEHKITVLKLFRRKSLKLYRALKNKVLNEGIALDELINNLIQHIKEKNIIPAKIDISTQNPPDFVNAFFTPIDNEIIKLRENLPELSKMKQRKSELDKRFSVVEEAFNRYCKIDTNSADESKRRDEVLHEHPLLIELLIEASKTIEATKLYYDKDISELSLADYNKSQQKCKQQLDRYASTVEELERIYKEYQQIKDIVNIFIDCFKKMRTITSCLLLVSDFDKHNFCYSVLDPKNLHDISVESLRDYTVSLLQTYQSMDDDLSVRDYSGTNQTSTVFNSIVNKLFQKWFTSIKGNTISTEYFKHLEQQKEKLDDIKKFIFGLLPPNKLVFKKIEKFYQATCSLSGLIKVFVNDCLQCDDPNELPDIKNNLSEQFGEVVSAYLTQPGQTRCCGLYSTLEFKTETLEWQKKLLGNEEVANSQTLEPS